MSMKIRMEHNAQRLPKPQTLARRHKKKTRLFIDNEFFSKGYAAQYRKLSLIDVYCVLAKHANYQSQLCFPSYEKIMRESGLKNRNAIAKAINKLEELNIIQVFRSKGRGANKYLLQDTSVWIGEKGITGDTVEPYQRHHGIYRF